MALLYGRAGRLTCKNGDSRPGQVLELDVKAGAGNVLACYVDGGLTTGWWYE